MHHSPGDMQTGAVGVGILGEGMVGGLGARVGGASQWRSGFRDFLGGGALRLRSGRGTCRCEPVASLGSGRVVPPFLFGSSGPVTQKTGSTPPKAEAIPPMMRTFSCPSHARLMNDAHDQHMDKQIADSGSVRL